MSRQFSYVMILFGAIIFLLPRLISLISDLPPYLFCDESIFLNAVNSFNLPSFYVNEFRAGGVNIFPILIIKHLFSIESVTALIITARIFYLILLGSFTCYFIYKISRVLGFDKLLSFLSVLIFLLSPVVLSVSRIWYPDNYIYLFSSGFLYYLLMSKIFLKIRYFIFFGIFFGLAVSTKYTAIFLFFPIVFLFSLDKKIITYLIISCIVSFTTFLLINYSIFLNFDKFYLDFIHNVNNYGAHQWLDFSGPLLYLASSIVIFATPFFLPIYLIGLFKSNLIFDFRMKLIFLLFPIIYIYYFGTASLVIVRNISILIPFLIPVFTLGIYCIINYGKRNLTIFLIFLAPAFYYASIVFSNNAPDSRLIAQTWIIENIDKSSTFAANEFCSGSSPAEVAGYSTAGDSGFTSSSDYVLISSYWNSPLSSFYWTRGVLQYIDPGYIHFYNMNNRSLLKFSNDVLKTGFTYEGYSLIKIFEGSGPTLFLFRKEVN
jgi:hypothetical protein